MSEVVEVYNKPGSTPSATRLKQLISMGVNSPLSKHPCKLISCHTRLLHKYASILKCIYVYDNQSLV